MTSRLEVIVGPMFSGKTERLIAKLHRAQYAKKRVRILKPSHDTRTQGYIASRAVLPDGTTQVTEKTDIAITQQGGALMQLPAGAKLADVVRALNTLGATPQDLLAILQAMKAAGALQAELEVI